VVERLVDRDMVIIFVVVFIVDSSVKTRLVKGDVTSTNNLITRRYVYVEDIVSASLLANELTNIVARYEFVTTSFQFVVDIGPIAISSQVTKINRPSKVWSKLCQHLNRRYVL
jgi:hypothetical protein